MENLNQETLSNLAHHLSKVQGSIDGIGALFRAASTDLMPIESEEFWGLGELFKLLSHEMLKVVRVLNDGPLVDEFKEFAPRNDEDNDDDSDGDKE